MAIADILGQPPHLSPLLRKVRRLGFGSADELLHLATNRGCGHYTPSDWNAEDVTDPGEELLPDEEIAMALVSAASDGGPQHIRCAAQLLSKSGLNPAIIARQAKMERCEPILHHIAQAGTQNDPEGADFWNKILMHLPDSRTLRRERLPHPSRFMVQPGWTPPSRPKRDPYWLRPK